MMKLAIVYLFLFSFSFAAFTKIKPVDNDPLQKMKAKLTEQLETATKQGDQAAAEVIKRKLQTLSQVVDEELHGTKPLVEEPKVDILPEAIKESKNNLNRMKEELKAKREERKRKRKEEL